MLLIKIFLTSLIVQYIYLKIANIARAEGFTKLQDFCAVGYTILWFTNIVTALVIIWR